MAPEAGSIWMVRFPFAEGKGYKWRPALILTNRAFNENYGLCWAMMITGSSQSWPGDIKIPVVESTGLGVDSVLRSSKIGAVRVDGIALLGHMPAAIYNKATAFVRAQVA
jgi:mRNA-degrading endonuclease toxin of MazEF toxin-antitoxin module